MNTQAMKFRLGVFALGAAILLAILIVVFGELPALFTRQYHYTVEFPQAPGVEPGTPVRKSGVKIGEVTTVDLDPDTGKVTVRIVVEGKYQLRKGDEASIGRTLVLADTAINFRPTPQGREPAPDGYVFAGEGPADLGQALKGARDLQEKVEIALDEITLTARELRTVMPDLRKTNDEVRVAAVQFGRASESIDTLLRANQDRITKAIDQVAQAAGQLTSLLTEENQKNITATLRNVRTASDQFDALLTETRATFKTVGERVDSVSKSFDALATDSRATLKNVNDRLDTVSKNAEALITESRGTLKKLNDSLTRADEVITNLQAATKPVADQAAVVMKNLEASTARLNEITLHVADFSKALTQGGGTVGRLISDPAVYNSLNTTAANLNKTMTRLDNVMRDLEIFADKIARRPELLGVGGAVNPSSGIKR